MYFKLLKGCTFLLLIAVNSLLAQDCEWNKDSQFPTSYPPLLINKDTWVSLKAVEDNGQRLVKVSEGTAVVVACSGNVITSLGVDVAEGVCSNGNLNINSQSYTIDDLACSSRIDDSTNHLSGTCGDGNKGSNAQIGFDVPGYQFYSIIDLCFDDAIDLTLYTQHIIYGESVSASDGNPSRPSFHTDDNYFQTYDPDDCYSTNNQDDYSDSLGSASYIDTSGSDYFSRGHLSPNADFLTEMEADATFYFSNAVPQWQPFNGGNWNYLEADVRGLAESLQSDLVISTGPFGNLQINGGDLDFCEDINLQFIPVPESVWKVIYDPISGDAVAVITSNHPHQTSPPEEICPTIDCGILTWLSIVEDSFDRGYTYCCTAQDLHTANPNAPDYPNAGILTEFPEELKEDEVCQQ